MRRRAVGSAVASRTVRSPVAPATATLCQLAFKFIWPIAFPALSAAQPSQQWRLALGQGCVCFALAQLAPFRTYQFRVIDATY